MSLDDIVNLRISADTVAPTTQGFGVPLVICFSTNPAPSAIEVKSAKDLPADLSRHSSIHRLISSVFSQDPKPSKVHVVTYPATPAALAQVVTLEPLSAKPGTVYAFTMESAESVDVKVTVDASLADDEARIADVCTKIQAALDGKAGITATVIDGEAVKLEKAAEDNGERFALVNLPPPDVLRVQDLGANLPVADALDWAEDNVEGSDWYGLLLANKQGNAIAETAAWVEQRRKLFVTHIDAARFADIATGLLEAGYSRTLWYYHQREIYSTIDAAATAVNLPADPGSTVWAYKTLAGIAVDKLTPTQVSAIEALNGSFYTRVAGANITSMKTKVAVGEWVDTIHGIDWLYARTQERVFGEFAAASAAGRKIPFTDSGADVIRGAVMGVLHDGVDAGLLTDTPEPWVQIPPVASIPAAVRKGRRLPDVRFGAQLAGAILATDITGTISD